MPYFYPSQIDNQEIINMYSFYNNLPDEFSKDSYDYLFGHIETESDHFSNNYVDLSKLDIKRKVLGHLHASLNKDFLGVPVLRSYAEKNHSPKILEINLETGEEIYHEVPKFINYVDTNYPDDLDFSESEYYNLFTIKECIDKESAKVYYENKYKEKDLFFRAFYTKSEDEKSNIFESSSDKESLTIEQHFSNFFEENKIDKDQKDVCYNYWR